MRLPSASSVIVVGLLVGALAAGCTSSTGSSATSGPASGPTVSGAWVRPGPEGGNTAGYMVITGGSAGDALVSASTSVAMTTQIHETSKDSQGMVGMHPVASIDVPAGGTVTLEPGGYHVMMMGLTKALAAGDTVQIDLTFQNAGKVVVQAEVKGS